MQRLEGKDPRLSEKPVNGKGAKLRIPQRWSSPLPRHESEPIRALAILPRAARRLTHVRHLSSTKCPGNDVVGRRMTRMSARGALAREAVKPIGVDSRATCALVLMTNAATNSKGHSNTEALIFQMCTQGLGRQSIQPETWLGPCSGEDLSTSYITVGEVDQLLGRLPKQRFLPLHLTRTKILIRENCRLKV